VLLNFRRALDRLRSISCRREAFNVMCADRIEHGAPGIAHFYHRFAAREMAAPQVRKAWRRSDIGSVHVGARSAARLAAT